MLSFFKDKHVKEVYTSLFVFTCSVSIQNYLTQNVSLLITIKRKVKQPM